MGNQRKFNSTENNKGLWCPYKASLFCSEKLLLTDEGVKRFIISKGWILSPAKMSDMVSQFKEFRAEVLKHRLDRPELRERIAENLNWFSASNPYIDWHRNDLSKEDLATKEQWRNIADTFLALIPDTEQIDAMLVEARRTAKKQGIKEVVEWLENTCGHREPFKFQTYYPSRRACPICWQALKENDV